MQPLQIQSGVLCGDRGWWGRVWIRSPWGLFPIHARWHCWHARSGRRPHRRFSRRHFPFSLRARSLCRVLELPVQPQTNDRAVPQEARNAIKRFGLELESRQLYEPKYSARNVRLRHVVHTSDSLLRVSLRERTDVRRNEKAARNGSSVWALRRVAGASKERIWCAESVDSVG